MRIAAIVSARDRHRRADQRRHVAALGADKIIAGADRLEAEAEAQQVRAQAVRVVARRLALGRAREQDPPRRGQRRLRRAHRDDVGELHAIEAIEGRGARGRAARRGRGPRRRRRCARRGGGARAPPRRRRRRGGRHDGAGPGTDVAIAIAYAHVTAIFSAIGELRRPAEQVAAAAAHAARAYLRASAPADAFLCDQLLVPLALAAGGELRATGWSDQRDVAVTRDDRGVHVRVPAMT